MTSYATAHLDRDFSEESKEFGLDDAGVERDLVYRIWMGKFTFEL